MTERWGAIYLFESQEASEQELPSRARELIGKDPDIIEVFDLEALGLRVRISSHDSDRLLLPPTVSDTSVSSACV